MIKTKPDPLNELKELVLGFRDARNWEQFHTTQNLLLALNNECAELNELFLWKKDSEIPDMLANKEFREKVENEVGDILIYFLYLVNNFNIDPVKAAFNKLQINEKKYPVDKSYNSNKKYNELT